MSQARRGRITVKARTALESLRERAAREPSAADTESMGIEELRRSHEELAERFRKLESLVEGLQDAVHRESVRLDERIEALQEKTEPAAIARALSDDARRRGI